MRRLIALATGLILAGTAANAAIVSASTTVDIISQPGTVTNSTPNSNSKILAFNEVQSLLLGSDLTVGGVTIAAGTTIDSHMILLNRKDSSVGTLRVSGTVVFDSSVLAVISKDADLNATDTLLGNGTTYGAIASARGLEGGDSFSTTIDSVTANLRVTEPGDWMRVVTIAAVPVPASLALLPLGLGALVAVRRRKKADA